MPSVRSEGPSDAMRGRVCVVTGANSGIGRETALGLARLGATVVLACRRLDAAHTTRDAIHSAVPGADVHVASLDLARFASVRACAAELSGRFPRIHVLVNNAGIYAGTRVVTADGHESTIQVNHLGPFLFTHLLLPALRAAAPSRIVNVASEAQRGGRIRLDDLDQKLGWGPVAAYTQSKLANIVSTYELARRLDGTGVTVNAMHPGSARTRWARAGAGWMGLVVRLTSPFMVSAARGADTAVFLASDPSVEGVTGGYWAKRRPIRSRPESYDPALQRGLWEVSARATGLE